ncbi:MAG: hypothetical protein R2830_07895 [Saprospiraceae bacterium]
MKTTIIFLSLCLLTGCYEKKPATVGGITVPVELLKKADELAFDYTGHLAKALAKESEALKSLLLFSRKIEDKPIADQHSSVLRDLLAKTGDTFFAETISSLTDGEKNDAWPALEDGAARLLRTTAPLSWKALQPAGSVKEFQGLYVFNAEMSTFRDCSMPEAIYYAVDETGDIEKNYRRLLRAGYPGQAIYAELKGYQTDYFGSRTLPSNFAGYFIVTEIIELEEKNYRNTCIPYDYWALGTEPFWAAQISSKEAVIEFKEAESGGTRMFAYAKPIEEDTATIYTAINQDTGDNIRITVKETPCSDGMSDVQYNYSVSLAVNGKNFSGCALSFEEREGKVKGQ